MRVANLIPIAVLWDAQLIRWVVWVGLVVVTMALLLLIRTRWGQQKALGKCIVLSLLAHLLLAVYMTTVTIVTATSDSPEGEGVHVAIVAGSAAENADEGLAENAWSAVAPEAVDSPLDAPDLAPLADVPPLVPIAEPDRQTPSNQIAPNKLPEAPPSEDAPPPALVTGEQPIVRPADKRPEATEMPKPDDSEPGDLVPPPDVPTSPPGDVAGDGRNKDAQQPAEANADAQGAKLAGSPAGSDTTLPKVYQGRTGDHLDGGRASGATKETEAAVAAALRWLAANQSGSGRWDARRLGGGSGRAVDNEDRNAAGATADTGLTGLALLAFLAAGHTHLEGDHRDVVRHGLEFLLASQDVQTGSLAATKNLYEQMYCHAMATCALSEAYAMTRDKRLLPAVRKALQYTIGHQDRLSGGWRYQLGQVGDTSQLGWQVMALKSAELGGIAMPADTRAGIERFLRSVSAGRNGGLACYQPTRPIPTRSMTAEALVCRQFLGNVDRPDTVREATDYVLQETPGTGLTNHYYWYYATLALYHAGGDPWRRWNEALQKSLLASQILNGRRDGSWDPDPVWGNTGGRVYSTALCTLCLEVYYRYLPLYVQSARRD